MGGQSWSGDAYTVISDARKTQPVQQIFKSKLSGDMSPHGLIFREACDSTQNPTTVPIAVFLDVTGSMGTIPAQLIKGSLHNLMETVINHGVPYPAILFGAIGDQYVDRSPLQVGQFESGPEELDKWLSSIHVEGGGGGNIGESYGLAWLVAGRHIKTDAFDKRGKKGYVFTIGDEPIHSTIEENILKDLMGYTQASDISVEQCLAETRRQHHVFHIHVNQHYSGVGDLFKTLLGENLIITQDPDKIAEIIASTVALMEGADLAKITSSMDAGTAKAVTNALTKINHSISHATDGGDSIIKL